MLDDTSVNNESPESVIETPAAAEQITTPEPAPAVADDLPRPPSGRRSKTRPAGPPKVSEPTPPPRLSTRARGRADQVAPKPPPQGGARRRQPEGAIDKTTGSERPRTRRATNPLPRPWRRLSRRTIIRKARSPIDADRRQLGTGRNPPPQLIAQAGAALDGAGRQRRRDRGGAGRSRERSGRAPSGEAPRASRQSRCSHRWPRPSPDDPRRAETARRAEVTAGRLIAAVPELSADDQSGTPTPSPLKPTSHPTTARRPRRAEASDGQGIERFVQASSPSPRRSPPSQVVVGRRR